MALEGKCAICYDSLVGEHDISVTPCGHLFHAPCVKKWHDSSQRFDGDIVGSCPECRQSYLIESMVPKVFANFKPEESCNMISIEEACEISKKRAEDDIKMLELKIEISELETANSDLQKENLEVVRSMEDAISTKEKLQRIAKKQKDKVNRLNHEVSQLNGELSSKEKEIVSLNNRVNTLNSRQMKKKVAKRRVDKSTQTCTPCLKAEFVQELTNTCTAKDSKTTFAEPMKIKVKLNELLVVMNYFIQTEKSKLKQEIESIRDQEEEKKRDFRATITEVSAKVQNIFKRDDFMLKAIQDMMVMVVALFSLFFTVLPIFFCIPV